MRGPHQCRHQAQELLELPCTPILAQGPCRHHGEVEVDVWTGLTHIGQSGTLDLSGTRLVHGHPVQCCIFHSFWPACGHLRFPARQSVPINIIYSQTGKTQTAWDVLTQNQHAHPQNMEKHKREIRKNPNGVGKRTHKTQTEPKRRGKMQNLLGVVPCSKP